MPKILIVADNEENRDSLSRNDVSASRFSVLCSTSRNARWRGVAALSVALKKIESGRHARARLA